MRYASCTGDRRLTKVGADGRAIDGGRCAAALLKRPQHNLTLSGSPHMGDTKTKSRSRADARSASIEFSTELIYNDDAPVHRKFRQQFPSEIGDFVNQVTAAHLRMDAMLASWPRNDRAQFIRLFLHAALNNLFVSVHFLVSGYRQPAGHQMRCHFEAVAMSLLLMTDGEWARFKREPAKYPAHDAIDNVARKKTAAQLKTLLNLDLRWWRLLQKVSKLYNDHSHSGTYSAFQVMKAAWPGKSVIGGEFDAERRASYRNELTAASASARNLHGLLMAVEAPLQVLSP